MNRDEGQAPDVARRPEGFHLNRHRLMALYAVFVGFRFADHISGHLHTLPRCPPALNRQFDPVRPLHLQFWVRKQISCVNISICSCVDGGLKREPLTQQ